MNTPTEAICKLNKRIPLIPKRAAVSAFLVGLLVHLPVMLSDIPNHDGLDSLYFDQNMITSGRWFLTVACGFSSYFTVPWVIGLLGLLFLGLTAGFLVDLLEVKSTLAACLCGALLVSFPALASTFAYVFTLDGYMMAMLFAVLSVWITKKKGKGFLPGALFLAFSMGIYQAYLPFAILLCIYQVILLAARDRFRSEKKAALVQTGKYLGMGAAGAVSYYVILKVLLLIQGKELASYQGIDSMNSIAGGSLLGTIKLIYKDFAAFTLRGNVLFQNVFSLAALLCLLAVVCYVVLCRMKQDEWYRKPGFYGILLLAVIALPVATSCILIVSPQVTYHLLMRYQWVLYLLCMIAFADANLTKETQETGKNKNGSHPAERSDNYNAAAQWVLAAAAATLIFCYGLSCNIGYSNLEKRYEKTYAYCLRLLDRIEQTEGYYQGIPVAMIGVVGEEEFPATDLSGKVTDNMIGLNGDILLYTGNNYEIFLRSYLGATLNLLEPEKMAEIYYSPEYMEMDSFPGANSTKVVDGVLYVKTENKNRESK